MKKLFLLTMLALALLLTACGAPQDDTQAEEQNDTQTEVQDEAQDGAKVVYVPLWMEEYSEVCYDAELNRTIIKGRDLTEEEIANRDDIDPSMMYGSVLAEPDTKVTYDLHGFIQNIYYLADDGVNYQLAPPWARG